MKHYKITPLTTAEENAWMLIVNDEGWNNDIGDMSALNEVEAGELVRVILMNGLRRQMNTEYDETGLRNSLVFLHVLENQDNIDHAHSELIDKWVDVGSEETYEEYSFDTHGYKVGDEVKHKDYKKPVIVTALTPDGIKFGPAIWWYKNISLISPEPMSEANAITPPLRELTPSEKKVYEILIKNEHKERCVKAISFGIKKKEGLPKYIDSLFSNLSYSSICRIKGLRTPLIWLHVINFAGKLEEVPKDYMKQWLQASPVFKEAERYSNHIMNLLANPPVVLVPLKGGKYSIEQLKTIVYGADYGASQKTLEEIATREYFPPVTNEPQSENTMQAELKITKVNGKVTSTTLNDVEFNNMQDEQIIAHISKTEQKIDELKAIKVDSKAIKKEITRLNKFVKDVAALLDAKK